MKLIIAILLVAFFCVHAQGKSMFGSMERTAVIPRRMLSTNTPSVVYRELRDPSFVRKIFRNSENENVPVMSLVFGGDDDGFSIAAQFLEISDAPEDVMKKLMSYGELRWLGLSRGTSIRFVNLKNGPLDVASEKQEALDRAAAWLPYSELKPLGDRKLASFYWLNGSNTYIFDDKEIAFVVTFADDAGETEALVYAIDAQELEGNPAEKIKAAADTVRQRLLGNAPGDHNSAVQYWKDLRELLANRGIYWRSPDQLNPSIGWK